MGINTGINTNMLRELNKIYIYSNEENSVTKKPIPGTERLIFQGYLTQPIGDFTTELTKSSLNDTIFSKFQEMKGLKFLMNSGVSKLIQNTGNITTAFNYDKLYEFCGTSAFSKEIKCVLVMQDDFFDDVINPLWNLLKFVIPTEGTSLETTKAFQEISADIDKGLIQNENWNFINDIIKFAWSAATNMLGNVAVFVKPMQFYSDANIRIRLGNYITIENVIIDKLTFNIPNLMYEDGLFDKVDVSFSVSGKRNISLKTFDWVNRIRNKQALFSDNTNILEGKTLNDYFK